MIIRATYKSTNQKGLIMKTKITYLGGPTYLLEIGDFRLLTDPGFDPKGTERSEGPGHDLKKTMSPPVPAEQIGRIDAVLLSHQQHYDNLDKIGRTLLPKAGRVLTTKESADVLGGNAEGMAPWASTELKNNSGETIRVTATPAEHGALPEVRKATGDTMGFLLEWDGQKNGALYITGDTVYFPELEEVGKRFKVGTTILHMGAAMVPAAGDNRLTMNAEEGVKVVKTTGAKLAFAAHYEGWMHYTEQREGIEATFASAQLSDMLQWPELGKAVEVNI